MYTTITQAEIDLFMQQNATHFESAEIARFKNIIASSNITLDELYTFQFKSPSLGVLLSVATGFLGIDRFYSGNYILGALKLCTLGCYGMWWIIDWFLIRNAIRKQNQSKFYAFLSGTAHVTSSGINSDTLKNIFQNEEARTAATNALKATKDLVTSFTDDI